MRRTPRARARWAVAMGVVGALAPLVGCGSSSVAGPPTTEAPLPAGAVPSPIVTMVCKPEAQREIADALGEKATVVDRTWVGHRYSCRYVYSSDSFTLSVQELSSWSETYSYYRGLGSSLGAVKTLANLGQGAFQTTNGSVVVRKDWKVLLVDISGLPGEFGVPPTPSYDVAVTVADVILGCWSGD